MLKSRTLNKSSWIYSFANEFSLKDIFGRKKITSQPTIFPQICATVSKVIAVPHLLAGRHRSCRGATLVPYVTIPTLHVIPAFSSRLLRCFSSSSMWVPSPGGLKHSRFLQAGDLQGVVSMGSEKTALCTILVCQSWCLFISLPNTLSCNA